MESLGRYFKSLYGHLVSDLGSVTWRSSSKARVWKSGAALLRGWKGAQDDTLPKPLMDTPSDDRFQLWGQRKAYSDWCTSVRVGKRLGGVAGRNEGALRRLLHRATDCTTTIRGSGAKASAETTWRVSSALWHMTHLHELVACEGGFEGNAAALAGGSGPPPLVAPSCLALHSRLDVEDRAAVRRFARCVWNERFFTEGQGARMAGPLLRQVGEDLAAAAAAGGAPGVSAAGGGQRLVLYSAHDYTLLSLMAAMRVAQYPDTLLGFGASLALEVIQGVPGPTVRAVLSPDPFPYGSAGRPALLSPHKACVLWEGVPLEAFLYMCSSAPAVEWPLPSADE